MGGKNRCIFTTSQISITLLHARGLIVKTALVGYFGEEEEGDFLDIPILREGDGSQYTTTSRLANLG